MKKVMILMLSLMMLSGSAMAQMTEQREPSSSLALDLWSLATTGTQEWPSRDGVRRSQDSQFNGQDSKVMRPKRVRMTQEQMTEKMISELKLDEKQAKKVTKLNKKFKTLIEGEQQENMKDQRPPMGQGRPDGNRGGGRPGGFGGHGSRQKDIKYSGATSLTTAATETGKAYESTKTDESALMISTKGAVTVSQPTISKTGDSDGGDNCSFYGVNAALLVKGGSTTTIKGGTISSSATGANGVFSYGGNGGRNGGTTVIIEDTKITTTGNGSGGIMTTGGGVMKAKNLTVNTSGRSSAPIRSDRGGGVVTVEGGSYTSNGQGSPVIYSTADITVSNAVLTSTMSEGAVIEGKNSITLNNCQMTVSQQLDGNILVGSDSELTLTLTDGSSFTGSIGGNITNAAGNTVSTETGKVDVTLDEGCTWNLTADTYITSFTGDASHIKSNGHCLYVNGKELKN